MDANTLFEKLEAFAGRQVGAPDVARDPVNQPMIRHWCDAVNDSNPVYTDPDFAVKSIHGGIVAPPTMLQAWTMRGLRPPRRPDAAAPGPQNELFGMLDAAGFTSVVATNCTQEYTRYLKPGDHLNVTMTIESVSSEKRTALGDGHFITQLMTYRNETGEEVATMRFRLLKFKPGTGKAPPLSPAGKAPKSERPRPEE